jgi:Mg2+ and Co2+ transporter CorA
MNTKGLPGVESPHGALIAGGLMAAATVILLIMLKKLDWL